MTRKWFAPLLASGVMLFGVGTAPAGLLPTLVTVNSDGSNFRWSYAIVLPTDSELRNGDYFSIYDFAGFVSGSDVAPSGWSFSTANVGPVPPGVLPTDDAAKPNLTWTYTGPTLNVGQIGLGNFMATSSYQDRAESFFTARTHRASDGKRDTNITYTDVPVPGGGGVNVPEPATLLMAGVGLAVAAVGRWRKVVVG